MSKFQKTIRVFFNASVILAGFRSPYGGSGKLLQLTREKKIVGLISEIVFDEVLRNIEKIKMKREQIDLVLEKSFIIVASPSEKLFTRYESTMVDKGDIHLLASAKETKSDFLVNLDKKHILSLKKKIKDFKIVSPKELIIFVKRRELLEKD